MDPEVNRAAMDAYYRKMADVDYFIQTHLRPSLPAIVRPEEETILLSKFNGYVTISGPEDEVCLSFYKIELLDFLLKNDIHHKSETVADLILEFFKKRKKRMDDDFLTKEVEVLHDQISISLESVILTSRDMSLRLRAFKHQMLKLFELKNKRIIELEDEVSRLKKGIGVEVKMCWSDLHPAPDSSSSLNGHDKVLDQFTVVNDAPEGSDI